jgi:hypothetical protein
MDREDGAQCRERRDGNDLVVASAFLASRRAIIE